MSETGADGEFIPRRTGEEEMDSSRNSSRRGAVHEAVSTIVSCSTAPVERRGGGNGNCALGGRGGNVWREYESLPGDWIRDSQEPNGHDEVVGRTRRVTTRGKWERGTKVILRCKCDAMRCDASEPDADAAEGDQGERDKRDERRAKGRERERDAAQCTMHKTMHNAEDKDKECS